MPQVGHPVLDRYLSFVAARCRPNTVLAAASDLRAFFAVVAKEPHEVVVGDVLAFIHEQRRAGGDGTVVRLSDGESGLSSRTIQRRLSTVSGLFSWLLLLEEIGKNPVPRGLSTRRQVGRRNGVPLIRTPRTLPQILEPEEVDALLKALRRWRDRAMIEAMLLGGLRRCEVLGLRMEDLRLGEARLFIHEGKGGHQRLIPVSARFFRSLARYLELERPTLADPTAVFVVLKGPGRGHPLTADGLDQLVLSARDRAGLAHCSCHELRHTCLTRLREAGMALEAIQAQAGHRSIESTRLYLHLANDWLAAEYHRASEAIDAGADLLELRASAVAR
ncbi:MAG: tyrosine-type recombinase/integrase [Actinomycetota bacterium]|nr:tyrosine-type recombinase/integrase [Actinomycetota bacterium]